LVTIFVIKITQKHKLSIKILGCANGELVYRETLITLIS